MNPIVLILIPDYETLKMYWMHWHFFFKQLVIFVQANLYIYEQSWFLEDEPYSCVSDPLILKHFLDALVYFVYI